MAQRGVLEESQRALLGRVEAMTRGNLQEVVSLEGGVKTEVGKLKQDMGQLFPIVVGLHRLVEGKGGDIRNLRKEFHENFAKGSDNLEALRSSMGDTVNVLVTAVTNDRELTKKLCVAVERLESEEGQN